MNNAIYEKLKQVAHSQDVITYSEIAPLAGLDMSLPADRNKIADILGEISIHEHAQGRPLLSVVVIHKPGNAYGESANTPGHGFFKLAKQLHLYQGNNDLVFFSHELTRVLEYWKNY